MARPVWILSAVLLALVAGLTAVWYLRPSPEVAQSPVPASSFHPDPPKEDAALRKEHRHEVPPDQLLSKSQIEGLGPGQLYHCQRSGNILRCRPLEGDTQTGKFEVDGLCMFVPSVFDRAVVVFAPTFPLPTSLSSVPAQRIGGRVVDELGRNVAFASLDVAVEGARALDMEDKLLLRTRCTANGEFTFPFGLSPGRHTLHVSAGRGHLESFAIDVPAEKPFYQTIRITLDARLRGVVRSLFSDPVPGAVLLGKATDSADEHLLRLGSTEDDGTFVVKRLEGWPARLFIGVTLGSWEHWDEDPVGWGEWREIMVPAPPLLITAVDARSGAAVERYGVQLVKGAVGSRPHNQPVATEHIGSHAEGKVTILRVPELRLIRIVPDNRMYAPSEWSPVEAGVSSMHVSVPRARALDIVVVDSGNLSPIARASVNAIRRGTSGALRSEADISQDYFSPTFLEDAQIVLCQQKTDNQGRAICEFAESEEVDILCRAEGYADSLVQVNGAMEECVVPLAPEGELVVRLMPKYGLPGGIGVVARSRVSDAHGGSAWFPRAIDGALVNKEGIARIDGLATGSYDIHLRFNGRLEKAAIRDNVRVESGQIAQVDLDVSGLVGGRIRIAHLDYQAEGTSEQWIEVRRVGEHECWLWGAATYSQKMEGTPITTPLLPPGRYRILISANKNESHVKFMTNEEFIISPGEHIDVNVSLRLFPLRLRLVHSDMTPLIEAKVELVGDHYREALTTDADGYITRGWGPASECKITYRNMARKVTPRAGSEELVTIVF